MSATYHHRKPALKAQHRFVSLRCASLRSFTYAITEQNTAIFTRTRLQYLPNLTETEERLFFSFSSSLLLNRAQILLPLIQCSTLDLDPSSSRFPRPPKIRMQRRRRGGC
ncbi:hypothetical protein NL676_015976 [Syzygium grande]|nr:hypothetical protein NL676_015976 [Syzygium grande]